MSPAEEDARKAFEQWYATHAFDYERNPIGSRDCALQWAAWQAAVAAERERWAKWHDKRAKMCEDSRLCMLQRGHDEEASNLLRMQNEHTESAAAIREEEK